MARNVTVTFDDGTSHVYQNVPDTATPEQVQARASQEFAGKAIAGLDGGRGTAPTAPTAMEQFTGGLKNFVGKNAVIGGLEHVANVGATYMQPFQAAIDKVTGSSGSNERTRASIKGAIDELGVDRNTLSYKNAGLATDMAATAGLGGLLAKPVAAAVPYLRTAVPALAPYVDKFANALGSSGFTTGGAAPINMLQKGGDLAIRSAAGATVGGASTGLIDPNTAGEGAMVGGALPGALKVVGAAAEPAGAALAKLGRAGAERLMQSALKPTIAQLRSGEAKTAVDTLLEYGINPTEKGVSKLRDLIDGLNSEIAAKVSQSTARVDKQTVVNALAPTKQKFGNQVSPTNDLAAIGKVEEDFLNHPKAPGQDMPVQLAQDMKQGTYSVLKGKYGQMGSAETEAQKGLARGLKEEIATAVPGVGELNAEESRLLATLSVAERRALMDANKNPMGLAALAHNPLSWAAFMADKSAAFKALAARAINSAVPAAANVNALSAPALYRAAPRSIQNGSQP